MASRKEKRRETLTHRLILPVDTNHHGTLYAGSLLRMSLEAAYAAAHRTIGPNANIVLRRVLNVECNEPVPVGSVVEIRATLLHARRAYVVIGLLGSPIQPGAGPWMEGLMAFVQISEAGRPAPLPIDLTQTDAPSADWHVIHERMKKLLRVK
ncbi:acyl-CoA thioesterase [bacterium]|nr:acyl-CoA thioesterase [bacterium]